MLRDIDQLVILAGGRGERLMPLTQTINKAMVRVNQKPFLQYIIEQFYAAGVRKVLILTGYLPESIACHFEDGSRFGLSIQYHQTPEHFNHGARLLAAKELLDEQFFLHKCDVYCPVDIKDIQDCFRNSGKPVLLTVYNNVEGDGIYGRLSNIEVRGTDLVRYDSLSEDQRYIAQDLGYMVCNRNCLSRFHFDPSLSLHNEGILGDLARDKLVAAYVTRMKATTTTNIDWLRKSEIYFDEMKIL